MADGNPLGQVTRPDPVSGPGALDRYMAEIRRHPLLGREEEAELARRIRQGDTEALDRLVASNLRFVVSVARRYARRGVPLDDLVNEGNLGLIRAARRFDETRGVRFVSYAVWWIRQAIHAALSRETSVVRVPSGRWSEARRVAATTRRLAQRMGRPATTSEIACELGWAEQRVLSASAVREADLSLDAPVAPSGGTRLSELLPDVQAEDPDVRMDRSALRWALRDCVARLPEREADVVRRYFGLSGDPCVSLAEIAADLGISRERAGAIRDRALSRLRFENEGSDLAGFRSI